MHLQMMDLLLVILAENTLNVEKLHLPIFRGQFVHTNWTVLNNSQSLLSLQTKSCQFSYKLPPHPSSQSLSPDSVWLAAQEGHILFSTGYLL